MLNSPRRPDDHLLGHGLTSPLYPCWSTTSSDGLEAAQRVRRIEITRRIDAPSLFKRRGCTKAAATAPIWRERALEIGDLQQFGVADPGLGEVRLGLARGGGVAACLMKLRQPVIRPAVGRRPGERALELPFRLLVTVSLQQGGGERLP